MYLEFYCNLLIGVLMSMNEFIEIWIQKNGKSQCEMPFFHVVL